MQIGYKIRFGLKKLIYWINGGLRLHWMSCFYCLKLDLQLRVGEKSYITHHFHPLKLHLFQHVRYRIILMVAITIVHISQC